MKTTLIDKDSKTGKALSRALGSTTRAVVPVDEAAAMVAKLAAIAGDSLPILYAGGSLESVQANDPDGVLIGFVGKQADKRVQVAAVLAAPFFSAESILTHGGENGAAWIQKIIEKELAHVAFRHLRNLEPGDDPASIAASIFTDVAGLVKESSAKIDTEALEILWPFVREDLAEKGHTELLRWLPGNKAVAGVAKAFRSKSWAERNFPEIEARNLWTVLGQMLLAYGDLAIEQGHELRLEHVREWLTNRDSVEIEPVAGGGAPRDESALDAFVAGFDAKAFKPELAAAQADDAEADAPEESA